MDEREGLPPRSRLAPGDFVWSDNFNKLMRIELCFICKCLVIIETEEDEPERILCVDCYRKDRKRKGR